jgi:hypothetical protein
MHALSYSDKVVVFFAFCHYLIYELVFFFSIGFLGGAINRPVSLWKVFFPVFLLLYCSKIKAPKVDRVIDSTINYNLIFLLFLAYLSVPSIFSPDGFESVFEWLKLFPRFIFWVAIYQLFSKRLLAFEALIKMVVVWSLFSVFQYAILVFTNGYNNIFIFDGVPVEFAGVYGLLGNVNSIMYFPGVSFGVVRLCGFWNEPSNASASIFVSYFYANYLFNSTGEKIWRISAYILLIGGFLCLSNAGYLSIGIAISFGVFLKNRSGFGERLLAFVILAIGLFLISVALLGRFFVADFGLENTWLKAAVGSREVTEESKDINQLSGGRLSLAEEIVSDILVRPLGFGVPVASEFGEFKNSASAPIMWLRSGGIIGFILIISRELMVVLLGGNMVKRSLEGRLLFQAWIVVVVQQSVYGSWMNPLYFIATASLFGMANKLPKRHSFLENANR